MHLAFNDHRIDDGAKVVHRAESIDPCLARFRVDFHFTDVGAGREREVGRVVESGFIQTRFERLKRVIVWHVSGECNLRKRNAFVGAFDREFAIRKINVGVTGFE